MLTEGRVFWLDVSAEEAVRGREARRGGRCWIARPMRGAAARKLIGRRQPFYKRAHAGVETDGRSPKEIVDDLLMVSMAIATMGEAEPNA
jgi:shikimate kinase